jgi:EAL domain-containing protein (putative c-di-GMP-specific phosphodiesterase class I)
MLSRVLNAVATALTLGIVVAAQQPSGQAPAQPAAPAGQTTNLGNDPNGNPLRRALKTGHVSNYDETKTGTYTLPDLIPKVLNETGLQPGVLQVEITERAVMDAAEFALGELEKLKDLGVCLAIDDFGMGYSGLYHLKHMPIDILKIDRAFITGLGDEHGDEAIVLGTVGLAHALGVIAVAEGVESADQAAVLKELGCDLAQGHYFAKPLPREAMEKLLADGASY